MDPQKSAICTSSESILNQIYATMIVSLKTIPKESGLNAFFCILFFMGLQ